MCVPSLHHQFELPGLLVVIALVQLIHIDVKKLGRIGPHGVGHRMLGRSWAKEGRTRTDADGVRIGIKHIRTQPYRPQTNGKAERFIRTMLREWAYAAVYGSSPERAAALSGWVERYNYRRRHGALGHRPPIQRLREFSRNDVIGIYS